VPRISQVAQPLARVRLLRAIIHRAKEQPVNIFLDNNVWDFLFERSIDLSNELPQPQFQIYVTREAEFEIPAIPIDKAALKSFIAETIKHCSIRTDSFFGFFNEKVPKTEQRAGGFNVGRFASSEELGFIQRQRATVMNRKFMKTRLYRNEADVSLGARSFHSVVLTLDKKPGPLIDAFKQGGKVVFLTEFDTQSLGLRDFILSRI
jgi:hypothetical protein